MSKKITIDKDVCEWAKEIVAANGEKFTPLSKGEQYVIAQYILSLLPEVEREPSADNGEEQPSESGADLKEREESPCEDNGVPTDWCMSKYKEGNPNSPREYVPPTTEYVPPTTATMTRGYAYHRAGLDAQQTFDKFLEWGKNHPKELSVMDFATGRKSSDAAFAYWLHEIIEDAPTGV